MIAPRHLFALSVLSFLLSISAARADRVSAAPADDWPQWLGPQRDGVWREAGILEKFPSGGPKVRWRTPIGPGYSGPAVVGDRVYVMDRQGEQAPRGREGPGPKGLKGSERVLCLNADTGKIIWEHSYDCTYKINYPSGPRTTPVVHQGKVYALGAMGDLRCLDADSGKPVWSRNFVADFKTKPPFWGWSAHLLVDGDLLYSLVGGDDHCVVAFDKNTGKERWHALTVEEVGYAPPMIFDAGGRRQLLIWHTEAVNALDPATGKLFWSVKFPAEVPPVRPGLSIATPQKVGDRLFITAVHHGPLMLALSSDRPDARVLWKGKSNNAGKPDGLHSLMSTPQVYEGHVYGVCAFGELRCLKADTGQRLWETFAATTRKKTIFGTAFLVRHGSRFFIFNDQGDLILARLTPKGYEEIDRAHVLEPTLLSRGRDVVWCHPAFARRCLFVRNDKEMVCVSLAAGG